MRDGRNRWVGYVVSTACFGLCTLVVMAATCQWDVLDRAFAGLCHQWESRCYEVGGVALPVCVRCIWIYLGLGVGHVLFLYWNPATIRITRALTGVIGLLILDVSLEFLGLYENWFWSRASTGFLFGLIVSHFTLLGLRQLCNELTNPITYVRSKYSPGRTR